MVWLPVIYLAQPSSILAFLPTSSQTQWKQEETIQQCQRSVDLKDKNTTVTQKSYVCSFYCFSPQGQYCYTEKTFKKAKEILVFLESHMYVFWVPCDTVVSIGLEEAPSLAFALTSLEIQAIALTFSGALVFVYLFVYCKPRGLH